MAIQRGVSFTAREDEEEAEEEAKEERTTVRRRRVADRKGSRHSFAPDAIGLTNDGKRGFVGAQWWAKKGRGLLQQTRKRYPDATPEEILNLVLSQALSTVDWSDEDSLPAGAVMVRRRLRRMVDASFMGRKEEDVSETPRVRRRRSFVQRHVNGDDGEGDPEAATEEEDVNGDEVHTQTEGMPFAKITPRKIELPKDMAQRVAQADQASEEVDDEDEDAEDASEEVLEGEPVDEDDLDAAEEDEAEEDEPVDAEVVSQSEEAPSGGSKRGGARRSGARASD